MMTVDEKNFYAVAKIYEKAVVGLNRNMNAVEGDYNLYEVEVRGRSVLNLLYREEYPTFAAAEDKFEMICYGFEHKPEIEAFAKAVEDAT